MFTAACLVPCLHLLDVADLGADGRLHPELVRAAVAQVGEPAQAAANALVLAGHSHDGLNRMTNLTVYYARICTYIIGLLIQVTSKNDKTISRFSFIIVIEFRRIKVLR